MKLNLSDKRAFCEKDWYGANLDISKDNQKCRERFSAQPLLSLTLLFLCFLAFKQNIQIQLLIYIIKASVHASILETENDLPDISETVVATQSQIIACPLTRTITKMYTYFIM